MVSDTGQEQAGGRVQDGRSLFDLFRDLRDDARLMLRQEVALAKAETSEKVSRLIRNVVFLLVGGAIAYAGFLFLLIAASYGIALGLGSAEAGLGTWSWLAPLIVGLVVCIIGGALIGKGVATLRRESLSPERTVASLEESRQWIASETQRARGR